MTHEVVNHSVNLDMSPYPKSLYRLPPQLENPTKKKTK